MSMSAERANCPMVFKTEFVQVLQIVSKRDPVWGSLRDLTLTESLP